MSIISFAMIGAICMVLIWSFIHFVHGKSGLSRHGLKESHFSLEIFYALLFIYCIVIIGFGLIYFIISFQTDALMEYGPKEPDSVVSSLLHSLYFSGVTLLTIGYGDISPVGIARLFAVVEALIGYALPAAFVLKLIEARGRQIFHRS